MWVVGAEDIAGLLGNERHEISRPEGTGFIIAEEVTGSSGIDEHGLHFATEFRVAATGLSKEGSAGLAL